MQAFGGQVRLARAAAASIKYGVVLSFSHGKQDVCE
jgi:hypothetical protein